MLAPGGDGREVGVLGSHVSASSPPPPGARSPRRAHLGGKTEAGPLSPALPWCPKPLPCPILPEIRIIPHPFFKIIS